MSSSNTSKHLRPFNTLFRRGQRQPGAFALSDEQTTATTELGASAGSNSLNVAAEAAIAQDEASREETGHLTELLKSLDRTQEATIEAIADLNAAVQELTCAVAETRQEARSSTKTRYGQQDRTVGFPSPAPQDGSPAETDDEDEDKDKEFSHKQVRLDGLEVYAVVSAVTAGTLVGVFDSYHPGDIIDMFHESRYLEVLMSFAFFVTGSIGIVCGLHCIFVFSLVTMYGRTALGMERDDALEIFFAGTGMQRYRGFQSFVWSLYALMGELIVMITSKVSSRPSIHLAALCVTMTLMCYVYRDTQVIMDKAGVIFAPTKSKKRKTSLDMCAVQCHQSPSSPRPVRNLQRGKSAFNLSADELINGNHNSADLSMVQCHRLSKMHEEEEKKVDDSIPSSPRPGMKFRRERSSFKMAAVELINDDY